MVRRIVRAGLALALLGTALVPGNVRAQGDFENLQVLPGDITRPELTAVMRGFTAALGVRCATCHVGEEGQPLSTYDMASDDKPMKLKAREMLRMTRAINGEYLAALPDPSEPALRVTCATCHGGVRRPEPLSAVLDRVAAADGGAAAVDRYRELRERFFGGRAYDFGQGSLLDAVAARIEAEDGDGAAALVGLALEVHAGSAPVHTAAGQVHELRGETEAAVAAYRRALEIDPNDRTAQRRLEALGGD